MKFKLFLLLFGFCYLNSICLAHGVDYEVIKDSSIIIKVEYGDGTPMSYAEVLIFSPGDNTIEYQNGRTDRNGIFSFVPNEEGAWQIKVDDGMGHGFQREVTVEEGLLIQDINHGHSHKQDYIGAIGLILGVTGFLFYLKSKKK